MAMDIAEQIRQHLPRNPTETVPLIDNYCLFYRSLFSDVRNYEYFKYLHLGLISTLKRKSLPEISKIVNVSSQGLHHFLTKSNWNSSDLEKVRLKYILSILIDTPITVIIDETGDRKKGNNTDYTSRQYLGSLGKIDQGIVSVNVYGLYRNITFPLVTRIFKPKKTLKEGDVYKTKIELATEIIEYLVELGFSINLVLADSLYGEASTLINALRQNNLDFIVSMRKDHGVWMPSSQTIRANKWYKFKRIFSDGKKEDRYIREIIYGLRREITYWQITTNIETMPENSTSFVMTNIQKTRTQQKKTMGNLYGQRTWVEYGFRQCKQELGWTDYRLTKGEDIEKWWEIINSVYWMISLKTKPITDLINQKKIVETQDKKIFITEDWRDFSSWKNTLINYRIMVKPMLIFCTMLPWLRIMESDLLWIGFNHLLNHSNNCMIHFLSG